MEEEVRPQADEKDWVRVGQTVRIMRELRGFTPDQLANAIDISRPYLANIEAGRKRLTNILLARIAQELQVPQMSIMRPSAERQAVSA